jgi:hypothetical protein
MKIIDLFGDRQAQPIGFDIGLIFGKPFKNALCGK